MFGRRPKQSTLLTPEMIQLIAISSVELEAKNAKAIERWNLGGGAWAADFAAGTLSFKFSDRTISGPVEFIGSYSTVSDTWLWGWANASMPAGVKTASERTRAYGEQHGLEALTERKLEKLDGTLANDLASVTVEVAELAGLYHAPVPTGYVFMGFTDFQVL